MRVRAVRAVAFVPVVMHFSVLREAHACMHECMYACTFLCVYMRMFEAHEKMRVRAVAFVPVVVHFKGG